MRFGILGPLVIKRPDIEHPDHERPDGESLSPRTPNPPIPDPRGAELRTLLCLLLVDPGRGVPSDQLRDVLDADGLPHEAADTLRARISELSQYVGPIEFGADGYRLDVDTGDVDAHEFLRLAASGKQALAAGDHHTAGGLLREALALWRGPLLADPGSVPDADPTRPSPGTGPGSAVPKTAVDVIPESRVDVVVSARTWFARLQEERLSAIEDLADVELALGDTDDSVTRLRDFVVEQPSRRRPKTQLVRALAAAGRPAEALTAFEGARAALAEKTESDSSGDLTRARAEALRALSAVRDDLEPSPTPAPRQQTSFVLGTTTPERVTKALASTRLVTLTGPRGCGKTRLAVEATHRERHEICFARLTSADASAVPRTVVTALGLRESMLPEPTVEAAVARLSTALAGRRVLLVLDHCEHVLSTVATLASGLLEACPDLRILITSRESLPHAEETSLPVSPLHVPPSDDVTDPMAYPAITLFAERACLVNPDFRVHGGKSAEIARICRALGGLPLAIELTAARTRTLSTGEISARFDDLLPALSQDEHTAREQPLDAVLRWIWNTLAAEEQALAERFSVFRDGADLDALERVCGLAGETVIGLVDKALVSVRNGRYEMSETVRAFAAAELVAGGEPEKWRRCHAEHYLRVAEQADEYLRGRDQLDWLAVLDAERENTRAALRWSIAHDTDLALQLLGSLSWYWWLRGDRFEAAARASELAAALGPRPPAGLAEDYLLCVFTAVANGTEETLLDTHLDVVNALAATWNSVPRRPVLPILWAQLSGPNAGPSRNLAPAPVVLRDPTSQSPWDEAFTALSDGLLKRHAGQVAQADLTVARALNHFRELGERWGLTHSLAEVAEFASWRGSHERATSLLEESVELAGDLGSSEQMCELLCHRSRLHARAGRLDAAHDDGERALALAYRTGLPASLARAHVRLADLARLRGDFVSARGLAERTVRYCWGNRRPDVFSGRASDPLPDQFHLDNKGPRRGKTNEVFGLGSTLFSVDGDRSHLAESHSYALIVLGRVATAEGDPAGARRSYHEVLQQRDALVSAVALEGLADVAAFSHDDEVAARLLAAAVVVRGATLAADPDRERLTALITNRIGEDGFQQAYTSGTRLTRQQALELALELSQ